ncbi:MAG: family 20 glycosylhydrolase [Clostridia bacterium]|nr:family 20 glycosylhydrolase [Clostridia bacterium]
MRNQVFKKLFSVLLALIMVAGLLPASAMAGGWGAMDVDTTPELTETEQPTESAEPTAPTETETPEVTEALEPTPENPAATVEPTQGEPTAEPTDEGIMPANVMPVQANVELQYRIVHLDCGRKYFSKDWIIALMHEAKAAGYNQVQLAFGNKGLRFLLKDMSVNNYDTQAVTAAIQAGNEAYYDAGEKNELTEAEMNDIFAAANEIGIEIVPLFNTPFHMEAVITAMGQLNIQDAYYGNNKACLNLSNDYATAFVKALMQKYITYFQGNGCKYFNFGADEYVGGWNTTFYNYANDVAKMISEAGMTARAFNDSFRYNSNTYISNEYLKDVCYWYTGYSGNLYSGAKTIADSGYNLINTNKDYYYVLDSSKSSEYKLSSGNYNNGNNSWENYAGGFSNTTYNNWNTAVGNGNYTATPAGSMFCIWCDEPGQGTETEVAQQIRMILRVIGARMQNSNEYKTTDVLVEGGFKADGTINVPTNNKTVGNGSGNTTADNDTVRVTGPNLAALKCETATVTIQGAAEGKIAAYNVTPSTADSNYYTEKAEVRIKIPEGWDKTKVKAFIVENGTAKDIVDGTATEDGWYVFTAPHFSVMGIYEQDVTYVEDTVTVVVGSSETVTIEGYDYSEQVGEIDTSIATVKVTYEGVTVSEFTPATSISNNAKYIVKYGDKYIDENGKLTDNISEAAEWTYERYNNTYGKLKNSKDQYLTYQSNGSFTTVQGYNNNNSWLYVNGTTVNMHDGSGYNIALSLGTKTEGSSQPSTIITFTGVKEGTTSVVIGGTRYTVKVVDATLENAKKLYIDFWVTNHRIYPTNLNVVTTTSNNKQNARTYYEFSAADFHEAGEEGRVLTDVIPQTGNYESKTGTEALYWKTRYLPNAHRQTEAGWTNKSGYGTDTITGANGGVDIERIRFYGGKWEYKAVGKTGWEELSGTTADETGNQIAVYYLLKTTITDEVTTYITDWPDKQTDQFYGVAVDYCVKYESDGVRNPGLFGRRQNNNTQWLNCEGTNGGDAHKNGYSVLASNVTTDWKGLRTNTSGNDWYRVINNIRAVETAEYEIYMVTVTPSESFSLQNQQCPESITYNEQYEKVIWAESQDTIAASGLAQHSEAKIGGAPNIDKLVIQQCSGMLVTYYVRAKASEDSLTVNYYVEGSQTPFHTYNIAVAKNTTFSKEFALTAQGGLTNNTVTNIKGKTETVQWDLKLMPQIGAQYRYTQYKLVRVAKVTDEVPKTVNLYYTFDATKTFVVDFGLPLRIEPKDLNENLGAVGVNITKTEVGKVSSFAEVIPGENGVITYKLTEMISDKDTFGVKYTGTLATSDNGLQEGEVEYTVTIIPATNVYYEDSFAKFTNGSGAAVDAKWTADGKAVNDSPTQALEALGEKTNHKVYGYDPAYDKCTMFSMGSARKVTVTSDMAKDGVVWPTAQFTFKGTGFDIISLTDNTSGAIFVFVYKGTDTSATGTRVRSHIVDNYYGYTQDENGNWVVNNNANNALYQIPVMRIRDLEYGEYTAVVKVFYDEGFNHTTKSEYSFWLDAVRVYDPMGESVNTGNTYGQDGEAYPQYIKLRSELKKLNSGETASSGALFIDGKENANISEYANYGPNNEVYLAKGQAITFKLAGTDLSKIETVQIGAKAPNGTARLVVNNGEAKVLGTATEMYYDITTAAVNNGAQLVTVTNTGEAILSLTNLKITYAEGNQTVSLGEVSAEQKTQAVQMVRALFAPAPIEPEPEPEPEKTFEPERFEASWSRNVMQGRKATLTVKTSTDVEAITVDGQTIRSYRTRTERVGFGRRAKRITYREFTYSMVAQESADFSVTAINAEGTESESITARLTVQKRPGSIRDVWNWFKGWF